MINHKTLTKELNRVMSRMKGVVRRGLIKVLSSDYFAQIECYDDERFNDVELWQQFGLTSRPPSGNTSEALLINPEGRGEGAIAIATTDRNHRVSGLNSGDAVLYGSKSGSEQSYVKVEADGGQVTIESTDDDVDVNASGAINIEGSGQVTIESTSNDVDLDASGVVNVGGNGETLILADTFWTALNALIVALNSQSVTIGGAFNALKGEAAIPGSSAACAAAEASCVTTLTGVITTFLAAASTYKSTKSKTS